MICKCPFLHGWLKYLVCPPIPPLSHLAIIMKKDHGNTACRNSTFLPPPTILFYSSSQRCPTYPLPYLSIFYLSILILYLPISVLVPPACPAYPLPPVLLLSATLQHTFYLEPADIPQHTYQCPNLHPTSMCYSLPPPFLIISFCLLLLFLPFSVNHVFS